MVKLSSIDWAAIIIRLGTTALMHWGSSNLSKVELPNLLSTAGHIFLLNVNAGRSCKHERIFLLFGWVCNWIGLVHTVDAIDFFIFEKHSMLHNEK